MDVFGQQIAVRRRRHKEMQSVRTARVAASRRGGPQLFANAHSRPPQAATRKHFINAHASAHPAAGAISEKGRPRRRSVKNRRTFSISRGQSRTRSSFAEARKRLRKRTFDCFKSAVRHPIQRSRKDEPEIVSPRRFFAQPFDVKRLHNYRLRCQSSLTFGGMTGYIFIKQA